MFSARIIRLGRSSHVLSNTAEGILFLHVYFSAHWFFQNVIHDYLPLWGSYEWHVDGKLLYILETRE